MLSASKLKLPLPKQQETSTELLVNIINNKTAVLESGEARSLLEAEFGLENVWNDESFVEKFAVNYFSPPFVSVINKKDGRRGTVLFTDTPRFYFSFKKEREKNGKQKQQR